MLEESTTVEYHQPGVFCLDRDNVALILRLRAVNGDKDRDGSRVVVANTHLLYNPNRQDVKLAQSVLLMAGEIEIITNCVAEDLTLIGHCFFVVERPSLVRCSARIAVNPNAIDIQLLKPSTTALLPNEITTN